MKNILMICLVIFSPFLLLGAGPVSGPLKKVSTCTGTTGLCVDADTGAIYYNGDGVAGNSTPPKNYILLQDRDDGNLRVFLPVDSTNAYEYVFTPNADGFWVMSGAYVVSSSVSADQWYQDYPLPKVTTGSLTYSTSNTVFYTTTVGTQITGNFNGTTLYFRHYADNRGGVWRFVVDGGDPVDVSTYQSSPSTSTYSLVASGLADTFHTVVATFVGDDPENAPSTPPSRGWVHFQNDSLDAYAADNVTYYTAIGSGNPCDMIDPDKPTASDLTETQAINAPVAGEGFAILCRPDSQSGWTPKWVPNHGTEATANESITFTTDQSYQSQYLSDLSDMIDDTFLYATTLTIQQAYEAKLSDDVGDAYHMWSGIITWLITPEKVTYHHKITFLIDTVISTGYSAALPAASGFNNINTSDGYSATLTADDDSYVYPGAPPKSVRACNGTHCAKLSVVTPLIDFYRLQTRSFTGIDKLTSIWDRSAYDKFYMQSFWNETCTAGTVYEFETEISLSKE